MVGEIATVRAFVLFSSEESDFDEQVQQRMVQDDVRRYLRFIAMSDDSPPEFNVFAVLDCNSKGQVRRLAHRYFGSVIAYGELQGRLGLKNI